MIIRFSVENYMSFKEQQIFSMAAGKGSRHASHIATANGNRLLKSSFIFGANAAGKSNFVHAIDFMRRTVISGSSKIGKSRDRFFRIDPECSQKPGVFQMELVADGNFYSYGFSINYQTREFQAEWLYDITDEAEVCLFEPICAKRQAMLKSFRKKSLTIISFLILTRLLREQMDFVPQERDSWSSSAVISANYFHF